MVTAREKQGPRRTLRVGTALVFLCRFCTEGSGAELSGGRLGTDRVCASRLVRQLLCSSRLQRMLAEIGAQRIVHACLPALARRAEGRNHIRVITHADLLLAMLFRWAPHASFGHHLREQAQRLHLLRRQCRRVGDRKSTRLNSSHITISYAV